MTHARFHYKPPQNLPQYLSAIIFSLCSLGYVMHFFHPNQLVGVMLFFTFLFILWYCIFLSLTVHIRKSILGSLLITIIFGIRFIGLKDPLYILIAILFIASLEWLIGKEVK